MKSPPTAATAGLKLGLVSIHPHGQPWSEVMATMAGAKITHVWDYSLDEAAKFARRYGFQTVCDRPEEMLGNVDAVLIAGGRPLPMGATDSVWSQTEPMGIQPSEHLKLARPFLEAGLPTLIDKPLADSMEEARALMAAAEKGKALLMSCSALRYDHQIQAARSVIQQGGLGTLRAVNVVLGTGPTDLTWYIIHAIEAVCVLFGTNIESILALDGGPKFMQGAHPLAYATAFILRYVDGPLVNLLLLREKARREGSEKLWPLDYVPPPYLTLYYQIQIFGDLGHLDLHIVGKAYYAAKIRAFLEAVKTGVPPISNAEMLAITHLLHRLPHALKQSRPISAGVS